MRACSVLSVARRIQHRVMCCSVLASHRLLVWGGGRGARPTLASSGSGLDACVSTNPVFEVLVVALMHMTLESLLLVGRSVGLISRLTGFRLWSLSSDLGTSWGPCANLIY